MTLFVIYDYGDEEGAEILFEPQGLETEGSGTIALYGIVWT